VSAAATAIWVWSFPPLQVVPVLAAGAAYALRARSLAGRGGPLRARRTTAFSVGLALLLIAVVSPIDPLGEERLFSAHMIQHILIGDLAPLFVVLGLDGRLLRPLLALPLLGRLRVLAHPFVALPVWTVNLCVWHLPTLYDAALDHDAIHALQHALFFTCGAFLWAALLEPLPGRPWFGTAFKLPYLAVYWVVGTVLANVFIWSSHAYYAQYVDAPRLWGLSAVADQRIGGGVMLLEGSTVALSVFAWLFLRWLQESELRQQLLDSGVDPASAGRAIRYRRSISTDGGR
jgi:putative membrane protein